MSNNLISDVVLEDVACPNGCSKHDEQLFTAHDRLHNLPGEYCVVRCRVCGLIRTNPRPAPESIGFYYPDDYGPYLGSQITMENEGFKRVLRNVYRAIFPNNSQVLPPLPPGRLLEVGCASGAFMGEMAANGWVVEGIEFSDSAAASARANGLSVHTGSVESAPDYRGPFDLVIGWMVMEHLHDPVGALSKLARWTKPGGWLAIAVPNAGSTEFLLFKGAGYALHIPNHLYHFTPETLAMLLEKSGWKVERVFHQRTLANWMGGLGYKLDDWSAPGWLSRPFKNYPGAPGLLTLLLFPLAWLFSLFGQTGRMTVWAQRKDDACDRIGKAE